MMNKAILGFFDGYKFEFLWDKSPKMKLLGCMLVVCLVWKETVELLQSGGAILYAHQQCGNDPVSPHLCQHLACHIF
jgi:hypothetical protein